MNKFIRYIPLSVCLPTDMVGSTPVDQRTPKDAVYLGGFYSRGSENSNRCGLSSCTQPQGS